MSNIVCNIFIISCTGSFLYGIILLAQTIFCKRWTAKRQLQLLQWNYLFYTIPFTLSLKLISNYQEIKRNLSVLLENIVQHNISIYDLQIKWKVTNVLFGIWIIGVLFFWINQVKKEKELGQFIEDTSVFTKKEVVIKLIQEIREKIGYQEEIICYENPYLEVPIVIGDRCKKLVLPMNEERSEDYYLILLHEMIHMKRGDIKRRKRIQRLQAIFWFQPIIYYYINSYHHWTELACDEEVMELLTKKEQKRYIELVVEIVTRKAHKVYVAAVSFLGADKQFEQRIAQMIRLYKKETKVISYGKVICIFLILAVCSVSMNFFFFEIWLSETLWF